MATIDHPPAILSAPAGDEPAARRELQLRLERYFRSGGYATERDVVAVGRSGERHEVGLLAVKLYGVESVTVMVDLRGWSEPIDRSTVAGASRTATDLGIDRTIVVSLAGCRLDAEAVGRETGVDLWYPGELERRLGGGIRGGAQARQEPQGRPAQVAGGPGRHAGNGS